MFLGLLVLASFNVEVLSSIILRLDNVACIMETLCSEDLTTIQWKFEKLPKSVLPKNGTIKKRKLH